MADSNVPSPELLRKLLRYDESSGKMFWIERDIDLFRSKRSCSVWNAKYSGKEALTATHIQGYRFGSVMGRPYLAHRVAWAIHHGEWPPMHIDHANGEKQDNRIANLRIATISQNMGNAKIKETNSCGYKGVTFHKESGMWRARLTKHRRQISLGLFGTPQDAHNAYCKAAQKYHGEFARTQ